MSNGERATLSIFQLKSRALNTRAVTGRRADIGGDAPGLVAGEIGRQVVRRSDTSGIGGEAEVRGLCLKWTLMTNGDMGGPLELRPPEPPGRSQNVLG